MADSPTEQRSQPQRILLQILPLAALTQGWTSTAWVVANTELTPRHGSPVFTAAISHFMACAILFISAVVQNYWRGDSCQELCRRMRAVPRKLAFLSGLGWTSTLVMVAASPIVGVALAQVLVVSGELTTAFFIDVCTKRSFGIRPMLLMFFAILVIAAGVSLSILSEMSGTGVELPMVMRWACAAFGCGSCLVLNSLGNTHTRKYIGAANASAISAFVASLGNAAIWIAVEVSGAVHFHGDARVSTCGLWSVIGLASSWMVFVVTFVPDRIGFALTFCLIIAGKMSGGLAADALALSGKQRPVTLLRGLGVLVVFLGALMLKAPCFPEAKAYDMLDEDAVPAVLPSVVGSEEGSPTAAGESGT